MRILRVPKKVGQTRGGVWLLATVTAVAAGAVAAFAAVEWIIEPGFSGDSASGANQLGHSPGFDLEDAQQFEQFSIYWVGEVFEGLPLTSLTYLEDPGIPGLEIETADRVVVLGYGDCKVPFGAEACPVPLTINIQPYCESPPSDLAAAAKSGPPVEIRGADVQSTGASSLMLWTNDVSISITGVSADVVNAVPYNLVSLTAGGITSPEEPLGPPLELDCPPHPHFNQLESQ